MIIGRQDEQQKLLRAYGSNRSEFIAVFGRRRVGKTFLIRETFDQRFTFIHTGLSNKSTREQLQNFQSSLRKQGMPKAPLPANWLEAFDYLETLVSQSKTRRKVVFIDEMPWMDAPRSSFLTALERFWNSFASARHDVVLVVCGSATSWIIKKILRNHGGLHNRLTGRIYLQPFTLHECELYAKQLRLGFNRRQLLEGYMIMGGIPYYWSLLNREKSLSQNIDDLFFAPFGDLSNEFSELYASLFSRPERYIAIIEALGSKRVGMTRSEIVHAAALPFNGRFAEMLEELEYCGFVRRYNVLGRKSKDAVFQLVDNFTLFYFKFIAGNAGNDPHYWTRIIGKPVYNVWCGLAFERLCLLHSRQIKDALKIGGVLSNEYSWYTRGDAENKGVQIDLLIDRDDQVINLCEIKFSKTPYKITAKYDSELQYKCERFIEESGTTKAVRLTMITSSGLLRNKYSDEISNQVSSNDLFLP